MLKITVTDQWHFEGHKPTPQPTQRDKPTRQVPYYENPYYQGPPPQQPVYQQPVYEPRQNNSGMANLGIVLAVVCAVVGCLGFFLLMLVLSTV